MGIDLRGPAICLADRASSWFAGHAL